MEGGPFLAGRKHPNLVELDSMHLTYPGFERDKREAEAVHFGKSGLNLSFEAALRRLKVKQRAYEEQKSIRTIHRSHPNLVSLDALRLSYPGWQKDFRNAECAHNQDPNCDFLEILRKMQVEQMRYENDRSHYRLVAIDNLKLSYPGWKADLRNLEKFHFEEAFFLPGDSIFQSKLDGLKRRQQIYLRSQKSRGIRNCPSEDIHHLETAPSIQPKGSYALLLGSQSNSEPCDVSPGESNDDPESDEERNDHNDKNNNHTTRAPYAVLADAAQGNNQQTSSTMSLRSQLDPSPNRPDPPEKKDERVTQSWNMRKGGVDCDEQRDLGESKNDPEEQRSTPQTPVRRNKLSAYVYQAAIEEEIEEEEEEKEEEEDSRGEELDRSEELDRCEELDPANSLPAGRYSAPPLFPFPEDDETSFHSQVGRRFQGGLSLATPSSSWAVWDDDRSSTSQTSSQAVWTEDRTLASATSSRAVWADETSTPYSPPAPYAPTSSTRTRILYSVPDSPDMPRIPTKTRARNSRRGNDRFSSRGGERSSSSRSSSYSVDGSRVCSRASSQNSTGTRKLGRCTICGDADKNHVFIPCGHLCACKECSSQVIQRHMSCPVCRGHVTEAIQVFL
jgi:hypothetical protein